MNHVRFVAPLIAFAALATPASATGRYTCEIVAKEHWLTEQQLTEKLTSLGWTVNRMKPDGGCWEVYGTTPDGKRVEGYFHPASGEQLMLNQRGKIIFLKQ
jgi:hypothetical protein